MYQIEASRSPGITEKERRRRLHQAYEILLSTARRKMNDAPDGVVEPVSDASSANPEDQRWDHATAEPDWVQVKNDEQLAGETVPVVSYS